MEAIYIQNKIELHIDKWFTVVALLLVIMPQSKNEKDQLYSKEVSLIWVLMNKETVTVEVL